MGSIFKIQKVLYLSSIHTSVSRFALIYNVQVTSGNNLVFNLTGTPLKK